MTLKAVAITGGGGGGGISGSGTAGYVAKFTSGTAVGDSLVRDNGSQVSIDSSPSVGYKLTVNGDTTIVGRIDALTGSINTVTSRASNDLVLQRDTVEAARIIAGGNFGIGTTNPLEKLSVSAGANDRIGLNVAGTVSTLTFGSSNPTSGGYRTISYDRGGAAWTFNYGNNPGPLTSALTIDNSGNVIAGPLGVGFNTAPFAPLQVTGPSTASATSALAGILRVQGSSSACLFAGSLSNSPFGMYLQTNGPPYPLVLQPAGGNVGVGTTNPGSLLTVNGNIAFNSGFGSAAVAYGTRAWVNINGTSAGTFAGGASTVSRPALSTTATVTTTTAHGLITGNYVDALTGVAAGLYQVTVVNSTTFTITTAANTLLSAVPITFAVNTVRASGNVSSVGDGGAGIYHVNFATAMPDVDYAISGASIWTGGPFLFAESGATPGTAGARTVSACSIICGTAAGVNTDVLFVNVVITR